MIGKSLLTALCTVPVVLMLQVRSCARCIAYAWLMHS